MKTIEYHVQWTTIGADDWTTVNADAQTEAGAVSIEKEFIREWPSQQWRVCLVVIEHIPLPAGDYSPRIEPKVIHVPMHDHEVQGACMVYGCSWGIR